MAAYENNLEVSNPQRALSYKPLTAARFSNSDQISKKLSNNSAANQQMMNEVMLQATYGQKQQQNRGSNS
jgi:competence transcription factor ComK